MAATLALNLSTWDLSVDANGNIAFLSEIPPANSPTTAEAQAAACAIKMFLGEYYWDTTQGVPYFTKILGQNPPLALLKQYLVTAALTVANVGSAQVFITGFSGRAVSGQVQVISNITGITGAANFTVLNPQGTG